MRNGCERRILVVYLILGFSSFARGSLPGNVERFTGLLYNGRVVKVHNMRYIDDGNKEGNMAFLISKSMDITVRHSISSFRLMIHRLRIYLPSCCLHIHI